jgi:hypothetical protein
MSTMDLGHPSFLALDRASLGSVASDVAAHLEQCEVCRGYVASLREPAPSDALEQARRRAQKPSRIVRLGWLGAPVVVAAAAGVLLYSRIHPQPALPTHPLYIGDKGFSSVWIYVKHGSKTALWDGKSAILAGDRLRLKVDPGHFKRVEVYSTKDPNAPELLYAGSVTPGRSSTLPDAWEVDAEPGDERLLVVFSSEKIEPNWADWRQGKAQPGVAVMPFVLPKSVTSELVPGTNDP